MATVTPTAGATKTSSTDWQTDFYAQAPQDAQSYYQAFFDRYLPKRNDWNVIEIGACPGSNLLALALSHGYVPVALDYLSEVKELPLSFARFQVNNLEVIEHDFLTFESARKFNVVMSIGFIEHFNDPEDVIRRHWSLVADGGFMFLAVPVFGPMQMALRRLVLKPETLAWTLQVHNQAIMNVKALSHICAGLPAAQIQRASYVRHMESWFRPRSPIVRRGRGWITLLWHAAGLIPKCLNWSCWLFSPYCLVLTRKVTALPTH